MNIQERAVKALTGLKDKLLEKTGLKKLETKVSPKKFSCDHCNKTFEKRLKLKIHKRIHTGEKPYGCDFCDYKCKTSGNLKQHKQNKHTDDKPYRCEVCDYKCKTNGQLKSHSQNNHTGEKFSCSKCSKSFSSKYNLKYHDRIHTGEKPFSCPKCDKSYNRKDKLKAHEKIHSGDQLRDKPLFNCSKRDTKFEQIQHLKRHKQIHEAKASNPRKGHESSQGFNCSECDEQFITAFKLRIHERIHTGNIKGKFNKSKSKISHAIHGKNELNDATPTRTLRISVRKIHSDDIFSCSKCDTKFTLKFALMKHEAKHNAITYKGRPFGCQHCGKIFTDPDSWQRHERLMVRGGKRLCGK